MEGQPLYFCGDCKEHKSKDLFDQRQAGDTEPTSNCTQCTTRNQHTRQNSKRKRDNEEPDILKELPTDAPVQSIEEFTVLLTRHAQMGDLCFRTRVLTDEPTGEGEEMTKVVIARVWEATGFKFTFKTKLPQENGNVQWVFECCHTTASTDNRKKIQSERGRNSHRMARFPCQGYLYITPHDGSLDCMLNHPLDHASYGTPVVSTPLPSSSSQPHPIGTDAELREHNLSGVSQPLSREQLFDDLRSNLIETLEYVLYMEQTSPDSLEWLDELEEHFAPAFKFVKDSLRDMNRGKCPETNEEDSDSNLCQEM